MRRPTPDHPALAVLSGRQVQSQFQVCLLAFIAAQTLDFGCFSCCFTARILCLSELARNLKIGQ